MKPVKAASTVAGYRHRLERRREEAEAKAARVQVLMEWQGCFFADGDASRRRDADHLDELRAVLAEYRGWYVEMAAQADRDLRFLDKNPR